MKTEKMEGLILAAQRKMSIPKVDKSSKDGQQIVLKITDVSKVQLTAASDSNHNRSTTSSAWRIFGCSKDLMLCLKLLLFINWQQAKRTLNESWIL